MSYFFDLLHAKNMIHFTGMDGVRELKNLYPFIVVRNYKISVYHNSMTRIDLLSIKSYDLDHIVVNIYAIFHHGGIQMANVHCDLIDFFSPVTMNVFLRDISQLTNYRNLYAIRHRDIYHDRLIRT